mmetsp:Transcript_7519/g.14885  ORF Transcript_7519/g.14885 Transcript_7519/m.14885 type:complete len:91 (+) Transcript_7519:1043-1315(+)
MVLHSHFLVGFLDLGIVGIPCHPKHLVIVIRVSRHSAALRRESLKYPDRVPPGEESKLGKGLDHSAKLLIVVLLARLWRSATLAVNKSIN